MSMQHNGFLAAGPGDGSRAGERFEPAGVGEASTVVADLSQYPGAGQVPRPGKLEMISASGCRSKWAIASSAAVHTASNWRSNADSWIPIAFSTTGG
jgi:hypothetical protein